jgi:hypothetical protein
MWPDALYSIMNDNAWQLYVFDELNGYSMPIAKLKWKSPFALSKLFDGVWWNILWMFSYNPSIDDRRELAITYIEEWKKGEKYICGYRVKLTDFIKARKKFSLGKNKLLSIIELKDWDKSIVCFEKTIAVDKLPVRKSISSGARIIKI